MSTYLLAEAALRCLIMGATILAALRVLRIHQVRAQRAAWLFALAGALAMPALVGWQIGPRLLPHIAAGQPPPAPGYELTLPALLFRPASQFTKDTPARACHKDYNHQHSAGDLRG
ncbi:MAG: hypothetical protein ACLPV8_15535 [Steroidobacteraceae bacterium]